MRSLTEFPMAEKKISPLTYEQVYEFMEEGFVKVSGLISPEIAAQADEAAWDVVGIQKDNPEGWKTLRHGTFTEHPAVMAMYTPELRVAAAQLASADPHLFSISRVPENAFILTIKPEPDIDWTVHGPHIDGLSNWNAPQVSFVRPWTMFAMMYLHDVPKHAGNTVVYPKSHRKYQALVRSEPERYRFSAQLVDDFKRIEVGKPVEVVAKAGDVVFLDQMTMHAGSTNKGSRPRFALNFKW